MHQIQNIIDDHYHTAKIEITTGNIGGSHVVKGEEAEESKVYEDLNAILLSDVFAEVLTQQTLGPRERLNVVLKIDIERFECKAFLGSPG